MKYTKPEIFVLGAAIRVIEQIPFIKGPYTLLETAMDHRYRVNPAYDLDE